MGQYLGGVVNVVVGFYTGNVWEMAGGVMQIVGTETNNSDLATASAVVGAAAGIGASLESSTASAGTAAGNANNANNASQAADLTATGQGGSAAVSAGQNTIPSTLSVGSTSAVPAAATTAAQTTSGAASSLSMYDKVANALSTPAGIQVATGVIGGVGNAYGQAYAAQKQAEAQQTLQAQQIAFHQWQAGIANTAGTGVVGASTPAPASNGLLGPITAAPVVTNGLPVPATTNPLTVTPTGLKV